MNSKLNTHLLPNYLRGIKAERLVAKVQHPQNYRALYGWVRRGNHRHAMVQALNLKTGKLETIDFEGWEGGGWDFSRSSD